VTDLVARFASLFEGRKDAYGGEEGACYRDALDEAVFRAHLGGYHEPIGVYPMVPHYQLGHHHDHDTEWFVKWGAVDLDLKTPTKPSGDYESEQECHIAAVNLQNVLRQLGVTSWIERTRSCGRHVWIFAASWVSAATMRRALLVACSVAGVSTREVNPKAETLKEGQLGNYVRLPYPGGVGYTRTMFNPNQALAHIGIMQPLHDFVEEACAERTPTVTLEHVARLWKPEPPKPTYTYAPSNSDLQSLIQRMLPLTEAAWYDEPDDRSAALARLARRAALQRFPSYDSDEVYALVEAADERWGKYVGRPDREQRLGEIVERAFS